MSVSVLLLHGLRMNRHVMSILGYRLHEAGFPTDAMTYHSADEPFDTHVAALVRFIGEMKADRIHCVAHSMGGVLILKALEKMPDRSRIGRVVLLGSPIAGCEAGREASQHAAGRWLIGQSESLWRDGYRLVIPQSVMVGSIAGNQPLGLGVALGYLEGDSDGVVRIEETRLPGLADHVILPINHTGMLVSHPVARQCIAFLRDGRFSHEVA